MRMVRPVSTLFEKTRDPAILRTQMIRDQIVARGIHDPRILRAMHEVPRERFTASASVETSYHDGAVGIGLGQTVSQPYVVARMVELLSLVGGETVLEVGTGLGYQAAVLSRIAARVVTIERIPELAEQARENLAALGYKNVEVLVGDGSRGHAEGGPYDGIVVAAAAPEISSALREQLAGGGRLVVPVGTSADQSILRVLRTRDGFKLQRFDRVVFVPLIGRDGFPES